MHMLGLNTMQNLRFVNKYIKQYVAVLRPKSIRRHWNYTCLGMLPGPIGNYPDASQAPIQLTPRTTQPLNHKKYSKKDFRAWAYREWEEESALFCSYASYAISLLEWHLPPFGSTTGLLFCHYLLHQSFPSANRSRRWSYRRHSTSASTVQSRSSGKKDHTLFAQSCLHLCPSGLLTLLRRISWFRTFV